MSNDCITYFESIDDKLDKQMLDIAQIQQDMDYVVRVVNDINDMLSITPPEPPPPVDTITVIVKPPLLKNQVPLQVMRGHNKAGYALWKVFLDMFGKRMCPKRGKRLNVFAKVIVGDGRNNAFRVVPGQVVDGRPVPIIPWTHIFVRHTECDLKTTR